MRLSDFFVVPFIMDLPIAAGGLIGNLLAQDLGASPLLLGLLGFAWNLPFALFSAPAGRAAHTGDRQRLLAAGGVLFTAALLLYGVAALPLHLILIAPLGGLAGALFWPCFETLLHTEDAAQTRRRMGVFNVGWTAGLLTGSAVGGYLYQGAGSLWACWSLAALLGFGTAYALARTRGGLPRLAHGQEEGASSAHGPLPPLRRVGYLRMAWVANFCLFFASSAAATIFPKLARTLDIPDGPTGVLLAVVVAAQGVAFVATARSTAWHYRLAPLLGTQVLGAAGLAVLVVGSSPALFALGLGLVGLGRGLSYSASLCYSLDDPALRGVNAGIHEAVIGAGFVLGPLLSGLVADAVSLRPAFVFTAGVVLVGMAAQSLLWRRLPSHLAALSAAEGS